MLAPEKRRSYIARQIGTLVLSHVRVQNPMAIVRAAAWANRMARLGVHLPFFVIHDLGLLLTAPRGVAGLTIGPNEALLGAAALADEARALCRQYQALLTTIAQTEIVEKSTTWRLRDDLVAVLLTKVLGDLFHRFTDPGKSVGVEELPLDPQIYGDADLVQHWRDFDRTNAVAFLRFLVSQQLHVYTSLEQIDLDTLRLLGVFASGGVTAPASPAIDLVDLFGVFQSAEANDVVNFSLELLPSVLETKRASGVQTFSVDGYVSIERHGNLDSLILSEFAYDDELFERKIIDDELYYYGHEKQREEERRLQYLLVDSSPSMRGVRQVFARGLALTLAKKLVLQGDEVWLRFFDSRLYDVQRVTQSDFAAPYLLCFKSERGRNYTKVFRQLHGELARLRREERRQVVATIITHGQCHIPVDVVQQLRREAYLYGIFILPSSEFSLDYLDLLHRSQIVDEKALASRKGRRDRALEIVEDAGGRLAAGPDKRADKAARPTATFDSEGDELT
jgi:hypothetical protein